MQKWDACKDVTLKFEDFEGKECWVAMDLANKIDLCALILLFKHTKRVVHANCPKCKSEVIVENGDSICTNIECGWSKPVLIDGLVLFGKYYLNEERVMKKENEHYQRWVGEGKLIMTEGAMTDFHRIEDDLRELSELFIFKELAFDQRDASYLIQNIQTWANFECIEFPQSPNLISEPMKTLEAKVYANEIWFDGDPILTWNMSNVIKKEARGGGTTKHYFPTKQNDASKIDAAVSAIMALGRALTYEDNGDSYNSRAARGDSNILRVL
jgi:phage terminase large subunit-like protein